MSDDQQDLLDNLEHHQRHHPRHIVSPADEAADADDKSRIAKLLRTIHPEDQILLRLHFTAQIADDLMEMQHRMLGLIEKVITFCCFPFAWPKIWGVIYALDLSLHDGMNMQKRARKLGATRAAISIHAREFLELTGLPPSRWMRSELTAKRCKTTRESNLKP